MIRDQPLPIHDTIYIEPITPAADLTSEPTSSIYRKSTLHADSIAIPVSSACTMVRLK